jgi:hypothetical protein
VWIGNEDLEYVKALVLNHLPVVSEKVHADFQMLPPVNIGGHYIIVGPVQKDLPQQLDRLPLGNVAVGLHKYIVVLVEEELEVD